MITIGLLLLPLIASLFILVVRKEQAKQWALVFSIANLGVAAYALSQFDANAGIQFLVDIPWISDFGIHFKAGIDGISMLMVLLTVGLYPLILLTSFKQEIKNQNAFYALAMFMQAGLLGVFVALDGFLFYLSWEVALIPVYFLAAYWGGADRIRITFKFFIYTIVGSLFMLVAIIYLYLQTADQSFGYDSFVNTVLTQNQESWVFLAFFLAFAIKIPIFPLHTWQPDTYTTSPTMATMLLSGIMLKMGIYGIIRWLIPITPSAFMQWHDVVLVLCVIGIIYASIIAFTQKDIKRLIAYSSIAHVGLIAAGVFAFNLSGLQGAMIQMINHGINVVGIFFIIHIIEQRTNTRESLNLGGIANLAPTLSICFMILLLGSVGLPLTNGFIGEFMLLNGLYIHSITFAIFAGLTIILGAVYMLRMYQKVMLGEVNATTQDFADISGTEKVVLFTLSALVILIGVYPQAVLGISEGAINNLIELVNFKLGN